ncbi:tetratricopeptide repeat protein [Pseudomonas typographi]|uniref:Tetratricopeptide repeat protein n=1 Tax=Pseudomonas typographi TaxID=2715964 RepID=A0ABR7Z1L1_9PSED|nr:tetratricopeptide repeat protein [Pseudomonas typographi]MBD1599259.1 tetratricopeptide repeat protein [Pseudomonas typographi]
MPKALRYLLIGLAVVIVVAATAWWRRPAPAPAPALAQHSYTTALEQAHNGAPGAARVLYQQLQRSDLPPERRARLYAELPHYPSPRALAFARADLGADNLLVRNAAIDAIAGLVAPPQRGALLGPLLDDPIQDIRYHTARVLLELAPQDLGVFAGPLQAVLDDYVNTLESEPDSVEAQAELARLYRHDGDYRQASLAIHRVLAQTPGDLDAIVTLAQIQDAQGQPDQARNTLADALNRQPGSAFLQHQLGLWLLAHGQEEYALLALTRAVELEPQHSDYRYDLAVALHGINQLQPAQQQLDELLRRDPADRRARLLLIDYWKQSGQLQNVQVLLAELEQQNPDDPAL